ncbi:glycosyltransferase family 2 protein [Pisolithus microcarpus 441]|uniref:dolichyl-phosphate beta-glucosyltransferase n=1 Tax=Pisolithus microcarpus 441 TaxID=765257 RepID=A0A0C9ZCI0_9AGAM|nr:glycosyltransferase family 2 protein [Pisolithus microcarpus]KIK20132.1 glycosyltransferase family 2 protein [Pisolithus microcarpus 441]
MNYFPSLFFEPRAVSVETLRRGDDDDIFWLSYSSPSPIITRTLEKTHRSRASPWNPLPSPSLADESSVDLSVVIPAYNETGRLPSMPEVTLAHLNSPAMKSSRTYEILIVDDGSKDDTSALALKLASHYPQSELRVVTLEKNLGKGGAVRHGMLHSRGHRLLIGLEHLWMSLDKLAPKNEPAVAVGSRAHLVKTEVVVKRSSLRNILMQYGLHTILRIVGVGDIRDTQCGFKLFTRRAVQKIFPAQHLSTWIFDVELLLLAKQLSIPVIEVPVEWHEVAGSKLSIAKDSLQMSRDLLVLRGNQLVGRWKAVPP